MEHQIIRHRHELKRRRLTVKDKSRITPNMIRILFEGSDLADFVSLAPDDHVKLFIPARAGDPERRDYTPHPRFELIFVQNYSTLQATAARMWRSSSSQS